MLQRRTVAMGWLFVGLIGCSSAGDPHGPCEVVGGPPVDRARFDGIDYRVIGGLGGTGNGVSLHIEADGALVREMREHETEYGRVDRATVDDLLKKIRAAQLPTLCSMYACPHCADDFIDEVSVRLDDVTVTTRASQLGDPPGGLQDLIDALQQIVKRPLD